MIAGHTVGFDPSSVSGKGALRFYSSSLCCSFTHIKYFKVVTAKRTAAEAFFLQYVSIVFKKNNHQTSGFHHFFVLDSAYVGYPVMLENSWILCPGKMPPNVSSA